MDKTKIKNLIREVLAEGIPELKVGNKTAYLRSNMVHISASTPKIKLEGSEGSAKNLSWMENAGEMILYDEGETANRTKFSGATGKRTLPLIDASELATSVTPSHVVKYAGEYTWSGGGASCAETVTGALATDIVVATIQSAPTEAASMVSVAVTENTVTTTLSAANTTNDAVIAYVVFRAIA